MPVKYGDGNMSLAFSDARHGWFEERTAGMGMLAGEFFATSDVGATWEKVAENGFADTVPFGGRITARSDGTLWLNGGQRSGNLGAPGFIWLYKSADGGRTWGQVKLPVPEANRQDYTLGLTAGVLRR